MDDAEVPEMEEELSTLPNRVQESNHLELPGLEPGSPIYIVCMRHRRVFSVNINAEAAKVRALSIRIQKNGECFLHSMIDLVASLTFSVKLEHRL